MKKPQNLPVSVKILPLYLGLAVLFSVPVFQYLKHQRVMAQTMTSINTKLLAAPASEPTQAPISAQPIRIVIPTISLDLKIVDGSYNQRTKQWSVAERAVNHVPQSAPANNQAGTTILYGHNFAWVLGKTKNLVPGDKIYLYGEDGSLFEYSYRESQTVKPTDVGLFEQSSEKPEALLMTCDGQWAQVRRAMYFDLVRATK
jgi:LPXTG-site transpeptidase (sortase) family protein